MTEDSNPDIVVPEKRQTEGLSVFRTLEEKEIKNLSSDELLQYALDASDKLEEMARLNEELRDISLHDSLTHTLNREGLLAEIKSNITSSRNFALVFIDLGDFKKVNDEISHPDGDRLLQEFAGVLSQSALRDTDVIARYGGDEFVLVLGESDVKAAQKVIDRVKRAYDRRKAELKVDQVNLKKSFEIVKPDIGYAVWDKNSEKTLDDVLKIADRRMYKEKQTRQTAQGKYRE